MLAGPSASDAVWTRTDPRLGSEADGPAAAEAVRGGVLCFFFFAAFCAPGQHFFFAFAFAVEEEEKKKKYKGWGGGAADKDYTL
jgi:hypothetical protein